MPDWIAFILVAIFGGSIGFLGGLKFRQPYVNVLSRKYDHLMEEFERVCREHSALMSDKQDR